MSGMRIQSVFGELDPDLTFQVQKLGRRTARSLSRERRIPDFCDAPIYAAFEDEDGHVCIGIAQDSSSPIPVGEWIGDQVLRPILRSVERVDIFGYVIKEQP